MCCVYSDTTEVIPPDVLSQLQDSSFAEAERSRQPLPLLLGTPPPVISVNPVSDYWLYADQEFVCPLTLDGLPGCYLFPADTQSQYAAGTAAAAAAAVVPRTASAPEPRDVSAALRAPPICRPRASADALSFLSADLDPTLTMRR